MLPNAPLTFESKYKLLAEISQKLRNTFDLDEILNHFLDTLQYIMDYDAAGIFALNRDVDLIQAGNPRNKPLIAGIVQRGFDQRPVERDRMLMLGKGITGHVIRTGQPVIIPDVRRDPRYVVGRSATLSEIAVPIQLNEHVIGALNVESDQLSNFNENDIEILRFFADAAAISIEKAMLHCKILEKEHMDEQLKTARAVQTHLTPEHPPQIPGYEITGICLSAYDIGGDYFDYIDLGTNRLGIALADVSGHGVPAALVMSAFRALLRTQVRIQSDPSQALEAVNRNLPEFSGEADYVTAMYGVLEPQNGNFTYTNCGHLPGLLFRTDGEMRKLDQCGPALGVFPHPRYTDRKETIHPGELLAIFTDGVIENFDPDDRYYGLERLANLICENRTLPVKNIVLKVLDNVKAFLGSDVFSDDFTLVLVRRTLVEI